MPRRSFCYTVLKPVKTHQSTVQHCVFLHGYWNALGRFGFSLEPAFIRWRDSYKERSCDYPTPLHAFIGHECRKLALFMIESGAETVDTPLYFAASLHFTELVVSLLRRGADTNRQSGPTGAAISAACNAVSTGEALEVIRLLLASTSTSTLDMSFGEYGTPLHMAANWGNSDVVLLLLQAGANVNAQGGLFGDALQAACARGHEEVVWTLWEKGARVDKTCGILGNAARAARLGNSPAVSQFADYMQQNDESPAPFGLLWKEAIHRAVQELTHATNPGLIGFMDGQLNRSWPLSRRCRIPYSRCQNLHSLSPQHR
jgi:hypothetical protein